MLGAEERSACIGLAKHQPHDDGVDGAACHDSANLQVFVQTGATEEQAKERERLERVRDPRLPNASRRRQGLE